MLRLVAAVVVFAFTSIAFPTGGTAPALAEDTVFRCGGETVSIGDSRYTVQKVCGKPSRNESAAKNSKDKKKQSKGTASGSSSGKVQKWTYDRGYGDYVYVLTFANDKLRKIEKSGRGR